MEGLRYEVKGLQNEIVVGDLSFSPNTAADPSSTYTTGSLKGAVTSITYSATGIYTIVFASKFRFPSAPNFVVHGLIENTTNYFSCNQVGAYNATTRTLVIQAHRAGTPYEVPASAGVAAIKVVALARNSTGK